MALDKLTKLTSQSGITTTIDYQMSDLTVDTITVQSGGIKMPVGMSTFQNITVTGNLTVNGTTTTLDTDLIGVDKLEVSGSNTTAVGIITQAGSGDILRLYDNTTEVFKVADGGNVTTSGSVGIADSIIHVGNTDTSIRFPADDTFTVETAGSEKLRITSAGLIGINNTPSGAQFVVKNSDDANLNAITILNDNGNMSASLSQDSSGAGSYLQKDNAGNIKTFIRSYNTSYFLGGNIGIGIDNPTGKLHIDGGSNDPYIYIQRSGAGDSAVTLGGLFFKNSTNSLALIDVKSTNINTGDIKFATMNSGTLNEKVKIKAAGGLAFSNMGAGSMFEVGGSTVYANAAINIYRLGNGYANMRLSSNYGVTIALAGASNNTDEFTLHQDNGKRAYINNEADKEMYFKTNNTTRMTIAAGGGVGIGVTNPNNPLTIHGSGNHIYLKDTATNNILQIRHAAGVAEFNSYDLDGNARRDYVFNQYTAEVLRIKSDGEILMGTTIDRPVAGQGFNSGSGWGGSLQLEKANPTAGNNSVPFFAITAFNGADEKYTGGISFNRSASNTQGTHAAVNANKQLGNIAFNGSDGTNFIQGAEIFAIPEEAFAANDGPTALVFGTVPNGDGEDEPQEHLRIRADGQVYNRLTRNNSTTAEGLFINNQQNTTGNNASLILSNDSGNRKKAAFALIDTGAYGAGDLVFALDGADSGELHLTNDEKIRITNDGNLCIGRTSAISDARLTIQCVATKPAIAIQCNHTNTDTDLITAFNSSGKNIVNITAESDNSPYLKFEILSGSTAIERFRVNHLGNVSIGGGIAPNRLEIIQDPLGFPSDSAQPNATLLIKHGTSGTNRRWVGIGASLTGAWIQSSSPGGTGLAAPLWINKGGGDVTLGNDRLKVASGGKVTVTSDTEPQVDVQATSAAGASMRVQSAGAYAYYMAISTNIHWRFGMPTGTSDWVLRESTNNRDRFWVDTGNGSYFKGVNHTNLEVRSGDSSTKAFVQTVQGSDIRIGASTNHRLDLYSGGLAKVTITTSGKLNINAHVDTAEYGASNYARTGTGNQSNASQAHPEGTFEFESQTGNGTMRYKSYIQSTDPSENDMYITLANSAFYRITIKASHNSQGADVAMYLVYGLNNMSAVIQQVTSSGNFSATTQNTHVNSHDTTLKITYGSGNLNQGMRALVEVIGGF